MSAVRKHLLADLAFEPAQRIGDAAADLVCEHQADRVAEEVISAQVEFEVVAQEQPMAPDGFAERGAVGIVGREPEQTARNRPVHQPRRDRTRVPGVPRESRAADRRRATPTALQREQSLTVAGFGVAAVGRCECGRVRKFVQQGLPEPGSDVEVGAEPVDFGAELQRSVQEGEAACECVTADFHERVFAMGGAVVRDPGQARVVEAGRGQAGDPLAIPGIDSLGASFPHCAPGLETQPVPHLARREVDQRSQQTSDLNHASRSSGGASKDPGLLGVCER